MCLGVLGGLWWVRVGLVSLFWIGFGGLWWVRVGLSEPVSGSLTVRDRDGPETERGGPR